MPERDRFMYKATADLHSDIQTMNDKNAYKLLALTLIDRIHHIAMELNAIRQSIVAVPDTPPSPIVVPGKKVN